MTTENTTNTSNKLFELGNETYQTYIKSLIWGQEQLLGFTRDMLTRTETFQREGLKLVDEYTENLRQGQKMVQEVVNNTVQTGQENWNQYRETTRENLETVNENVSKAQAKVARAASNN